MFHLSGNNVPITILLFYFILNLNHGQILGHSSSVSVRDTYWFLCFLGSNSDYSKTIKCFKALLPGMLNEFLRKNWRKNIY